MNRIFAASAILILCVFSGNSRAQSFDDEFNGFALDARWSWVREDRPFWSLDGSQLQIISQAGALNGTDYNDVKNILLQDAPVSGDFRFITKLDFSPDSSLHNAGLIYRLSDDNYIRVSRGVFNTMNGVWLETEVNGVTQLDFAPGVVANPLYLSLSRVSDSTFRCMYSLDGNTWTMIHERNLSFPSGQARIGLQAANGQGIVTTKRIPARFDFIRVILGESRDARPAAAIPPSIHGMFPNPVSVGGTSTVRFTLPGQSGVLRLTDVMGRIVWRFDITDREAGEQQTRLPLHRIAPGVYTLSLESDYGTAGKTMIVL